MDSPGLEYKTLEKCYPEVVACLMLSPSNIDTQLRPYEILPESDRSFVNNPKHDNDEKARKITDVVMTQVKIDPQVYDNFLRALRAAGNWTRNLVEKIKCTYASLSTTGEIIVCLYTYGN